MDWSYNFLSEFHAANAIVVPKPMKVLSKCAQRFSDGYSVIIAEALAVLKGLQFALASGLLPAILDYDSLDVVTAIDNPSTYSSEVGLVIIDILEMLGRCPGSKVLHVPRSVNMTAHTLVRFALSLDRDYF
ncbi:hypothetical protein ACOSP7_029069 [Xanthoceras sorbifolium]